MGFFEGLWEIKGTNRTLKINGPLGSDQYTFKYSFKNQSETVAIYFSNDTQALLIHSEGRSTILIIDSNTFRIDGQTFIILDKEDK